MTKTSPTASKKILTDKPKRGRPTIYGRPMTAAERMRRWRAGKTTS